MRNQRAMTRWLGRPPIRVIERAALHSLGAIFLVLFTPVELLIKASALAAFTFHSKQTSQLILKYWRWMPLRVQLFAAVISWKSLALGVLLS
jgi:hypothetical protein